MQSSQKLFSKLLLLWFEFSVSSKSVKTWPLACGVHKLFSFMSSDLLLILVSMLSDPVRKLLPISMSSSIFLTFFSVTLRVSGLTWRSLIYVESSYEQSER